MEHRLGGDLVDEDRSETSDGRFPVLAVRPTLVDRTLPNANPTQVQLVT